MAAAVEGVGALGAGSRIMMSSSSSNEMYVGPDVDVREGAGVEIGAVAGACRGGGVVCVCVWGGGGGGGGGV